MFSFVVVFSVFFLLFFHACPLHEWEREKMKERKNGVHKFLNQLHEKGFFFSDELQIMIIV